MLLSIMSIYRTTKTVSPAFYMIKIFSLLGRTMENAGIFFLKSLSFRDWVRKARLVSDSLCKPMLMLNS